MIAFPARRLAAAAFPAILVTATAACSGNHIQPDVPALRSNATPASTLELEQVLSSALNGVEVTVAGDALTESSSLIIERGLRRRVDAPPELGRDYGRPQHFRLVIDAQSCFLVHEETGLRWLLTETDCVAEQVSSR